MAGNRRGRRAFALASALTIALASVSLSGCGILRDKEDEGRPDANNPAAESEDRTAASEEGGAAMAGDPRRAVVPFEQIGERMYGDAEKLAGLIGFRTEYSEDGKSLLIGDHDAFMTITADSREVVKDERSLRMAYPAILADGRMLVPSNELKKLFGDEALLTVDAAQAVVLPKPADKEADVVTDFADDPNIIAAGRKKGAPWKSLADEGSDSAAELIREAKRHLGVPYQFGAAHYSVSRRFDCSSFVQYLFAQKGVELPRTARAQALRGNEVPRDKLRPGDLLFFYVPGRFKNDTTVGHVGIYIGDQKMIHSSPLPEDGVQITDINKPYWKETFLFAKRIL